MRETQLRQEAGSEQRVVAAVRDEVQTADEAAREDERLRALELVRLIVQVQVGGEPGRDRLEVVDVAARAPLLEVDL